MAFERKSRWAKRDNADTGLPKSADEYRAWFAKEVALYRQNPGRPPVTPPNQPISAWQRRGLELLNEERERAKLWDWGE